MCPPGIVDRHLGSVVASETWQHFSQVLELLPAAVYTTDAAGRITFYNEAAVELAGHRPDLGRDLWCVSWRLRRPDGTPLPHDECPMAIALREDRPVRGVAVIAERPDGTRVHLLPYPTPLHDSSGVLIGAVNMLIDITERKQAEAAVRQLNETLEQRIEQRSQMMAQAFDELRVSEERFRLLVQGVADYAIFMIDPNGFVTNWNAGAARSRATPRKRSSGAISRSFIPKRIAGGDCRRRRWKRRGGPANTRPRDGGFARTAPGSGRMW